MAATAVSGQAATATAATISQPNALTPIADQPQGGGEPQPGPDGHEVAPSGRSRITTRGASGAGSTLTARVTTGAAGRAVR